jgi:hypothetical protein
MKMVCQIQTEQSNFENCREMQETVHSDKYRCSEGSEKTHLFGKK